MSNILASVANVTKPVKPDEPSFLSSLFWGIESLFGISPFGAGPTLASKLPGACVNPMAETMMARLNRAEDDPVYIKVKKAIDDARERINEGGGLGNQDADLLVGVEECLEAAAAGGKLEETFESLIAVANDLGHSTETLMP